jgi:hypothetical protein
MKPRLAVWLLIGSVHSPSCFGQQEQVKGAAPVTEQLSGIRFEKGRLTAKFSNWSLQSVSGQLASSIGVNLVLSEGLEETLVSADVNGVELDIAVRSLLAGYDTFFFYDGSKSLPAALRTVWVYPKGSASALKPVRPEQWASRGELEAGLRDSDPAARESAYEGLMSRPDQRSRSLVIDALTGNGERDSGLRERLLSTAISKGVELPDQVLADLARTDPSDQIRWIALDALSQHPSAKQVAQAALVDPSEAVRLRAKEILAERESRRASPPASTDN